jgi:hypothetical protein
MENLLQGPITEMIKDQVEHRLQVIKQMAISAFLYDWAMLPRKANAQDQKRAGTHWPNQQTSLPPSASGC